jgi:hypothetical protein
MAQVRREVADLAETIREAAEGASAFKMPESPLWPVIEAAKSARHALEQEIKAFKRDQFKEAEEPLKAALLAGLSVLKGLDADFSPDWWLKNLDTSRIEATPAAETEDYTVPSLPHTPDRPHPPTRARKMWAAGWAGINLDAEVARHEAEARAADEAHAEAWMADYRKKVLAEFGLQGDA